MDQKEQKAYNQRLIEEFRAQRGQAGGPFEKRQLLVLTTTGARSGQGHSTPMMYVRDGKRLMVIASNAGAPRHPDWYHNLVTHPQVTVEAGTETFEATASVAQGEERQRLWDSLVVAFPFFAEHQAKVTRQIPLVLLTRLAGGQP
jgi:deazaflavin-dependent oxidoreductase (nitroreductase family)